MKVTYDITEGQLRALRAVSEGCTQDVERSYQGISPHWNGATPIVTYMPLDGAESTNWGGKMGCSCSDNNGN